VTHSVILARRVSLIAPLAVPFITTHYLAWFLLNRIRTGEYALHTATIEKVLSVMGDKSHEVPQVDKEVLLQEFRRAKQRTPGVSMLLLTTADGRALAALDENGSDPRRLAAMTNSFLTLGETVVKELGLAAADYATIATRQGNMVLIRMDHAKPMTLAALGTFDINVAVLLFAARECATRISALMPK